MDGREFKTLKSPSSHLYVLVDVCVCEKISSFSATGCNFISTGLGWVFLVI